MRIPGTPYEITRLYGEEESTAALGIDPEEPESFAETDEYAAADRPAPARSGAVGKDGESYESYGYAYSGGPDTNPLLSGRNKYLVYNEMRRSDAAIKSLLWLFKLPIRSAHWATESPGEGENPVDRMVKEAVDRQLGLDGREGRLDLAHDDSLAQSLLKLDWGSMFEEIIWADAEDWIFDDGSRRLVRPIARLAPRQPHSVINIADDPDTGRIVWLEQDIPGARPIPGDKLVWYVLEKEGRNWYGTSLLRPCYGPWRLKKALMIGAGIGWDRYAAGVPVVRYPESGGVDAEKRAEQIGQNYRTHERAWVTFPGPPPPAGGWDLDIKTAQMSDPTSLLRHYDEQIAMSGLQMFAKLGTTETGSRAVGEVLGEPFYMAAQAIADSVADIRQRLLIRRFVDVNFGPEIDAPRLKVSKLQGKSLSVIAAAIGTLASAGFNFADRDTQNQMREKMDLDALPEPLASALDEAGADVVPAVEGTGLGFGGASSPPPP